MNKWKHDNKFQYFLTRECRGTIVKKKHGLVSCEKKEVTGRIQATAKLMAMSVWKLEIFMKMKHTEEGHSGLIPVKLENLLTEDFKHNSGRKGDYTYYYRVVGKAMK